MPVTANLPISKQLPVKTQQPCDHLYALRGVMRGVGFRVDDPHHAASDQDQSLHHYICRYCGETFAEYQPHNYL